MTPEGSLQPTDALLRALSSELAADERSRAFSARTAFEIEGWVVQLIAPDGQVAGQYPVSTHRTPEAKLQDMLYQFQELLMDEFVAAWPRCDEHSHPPVAVVDNDGLAKWRCPSTGTTLRRIGDVDDYHHP